MRWVVKYLSVDVMTRTRCIVAQVTVCVVYSPSAIGNLVRCVGRGCRLALKSFSRGLIKCLARFCFGTASLSCVWKYVCMYMHICMYIYVCMCVYMFVCIDACMHVCMYVCAYVCCVYVCIYILCMHACVYVCAYVCARACVCMYVCIRVYRS